MSKSGARAGMDRAAPPGDCVQGMARGGGEVGSCARSSVRSQFGSNQTAQAIIAQAQSGLEWHCCLKTGNVAARRSTRACSSSRRCAYDSCMDHSRRQLHGPFANSPSVGVCLSGFFMPSSTREDESQDQWIPKNGPGGKRRGTGPTGPSIRAHIPWAPGLPAVGPAGSGPSGARVLGSGGREGLGGQLAPKQHGSVFVPTINRRTMSFFTRHGGHQDKTALFVKRAKEKLKVDSFSMLVVRHRSHRQLPHHTFTNSIN